MNALTDIQMKAIYAGLAKAGLRNQRIVSLHLELRMSHSLLWM